MKCIDCGGETAKTPVTRTFKVYSVANEDDERLEVVVRDISGDTCASCGAVYFDKAAGEYIDAEIVKAKVRAWDVRKWTREEKQ